VAELVELYRWELWPHSFGKVLIEREAAMPGDGIFCMRAMAQLGQEIGGTLFAAITGKLAAVEAAPPSLALGMYLKVVNGEKHHCQDEAGWGCYFCACQ
jgi:hypothetical protein